MMREEIQAYLDGEVALEDLPEALRDEARSWAAMLSDVAATAPAGAPLGFDGRVMREIDAGASRRSSLWSWLVP